MVADTTPSSIAKLAKLRIKPATMNSGRRRLRWLTPEPSRMGSIGSTQGEAMVSRPARKASGVSSGLVMVGSVFWNDSIGPPAGIWHMSRHPRQCNVLCTWSGCTHWDTNLCQALGIMASWKTKTTS